METDKRGDALIAYLDSPEFLKASTNATRLVNKLKTAVQRQELYETHQILRTVYFRFINNDDKIEPLVGLLYHGSHYLINNLELISGQDIATLFVESSAKLLQLCLDGHGKSSNTRDMDICQKLSQLAIKLPDSEMGQAKFIAEALKQLNPKILNRDMLHAAMASQYWQERSYTNARYHFLHCASLDNAQDIATLLVEYHSHGANKSEIDLFITQFIFQFLCLQSPLDKPIPSGSGQRTSNTSSSLVSVSRKSRSIIKSIAEKIFTTYTMKHPQLEQVDVPFKLLPLLNFTYFIISILDASKQPEQNTFKILCDIYKTTWIRDPNYQSYLNRIGVLYFGLADQNKQQQQQGGFLNNILISLMDGTDDDEEEDDDDDGAGSNAHTMSSCDELD